MIVIEEGTAIAKDNMSFEKGIVMWKKGESYPYKIDGYNLMISTEQGYWSYWKWTYKIILEELSFDFIVQNRSYEVR